MYCQPGSLALELVLIGYCLLELYAEVGGIINTFDSLFVPRARVKLSDVQFYD